MALTEINQSKLIRSKCQNTGNEISDLKTCPGYDFKSATGDKKTNKESGWESYEKRDQTAVR